MENQGNDYIVDEQEFSRAVDQAMGLDHRLEAEPAPIVVQLPDLERWLHDE